MEVYSKTMGSSMKNLFEQYVPLLLLSLSYLTNPPQSCRKHLEEPPRGHRGSEENQVST